MFPLLHKFVTIRTGVYSALEKIQSLPFLSVEQSAAIADAAGNSQHVSTIHAALQRATQMDPVATAALAAAPTPGKPHPFLQWLANGGWQTVYNIVAGILAALGVIHLPPLPAPTPVPTVPAAAGTDMLVPTSARPMATLLESIA
jgi:hypothetical protein